MIHDELICFTYPEEFKFITYPGIKPRKYSISNHGRLYNNDKGIYMKTYFDSDLHEKITLVTSEKKKNGKGYKSKHYFIHRLMAWEFFGPPPTEELNIVNHLDGVPYHNWIHNLEWTSVLENTKHAKRMGLLNNAGVNAKVCKYDESFIRSICSLFEQGYGNVEIYEILYGDRNYKKNNAIYQLINKLGKKVCYWDIVSEYNYSPPKSFYKSDSVTKQIRDMIGQGKTNLEILNYFGFKTFSSDKKFYNKIISERAKYKAYSTTRES